MKRQWETEELVEHWTLHAGDLALLGNKTGATRLGFAVLLKFFQQEGRFPSSKTEIPFLVIRFVATQVGVDPEAYMHYDWQGRAIKEHRAQIREAQLLAKRDELVREYHLGELELYRTPMPARKRAIIAAVGFGFCLVLGIIVSLSQDQFDLATTAILIGVFAVGACIWYALDFLNRTSVYVYTNGLVFFRRGGGRVVHWEEIRKVEIDRDSEGSFETLFVKLNDNTSICFPESRSRGSASNNALQMFIEEKMAQTSRIPDQ